MANPIHDWISEQEADRSLSLEEFYDRIKGAMHALRDRLEIAPADGIDPDGLEGEE